LLHLLYNLIYSTPLHHFFTSDTVLGNIDLMAPVVAPITEEILKVLPVVVFFCLGRNLSWRRITGPLDVMLLAAASGAGFNFIENICRVTDNYWTNLGPDTVALHASLHIGPFYLFPDMIASDMYGVPTVWFGHAELTACIGLAMGLGFYIRKYFKPWWLIPLFVLFWAIWELPGKLSWPRTCTTVGKERFRPLISTAICFPIFFWGDSF
jgi:RsiW-degrading membrane proteinase PrsW (M82 family)